MAGNEPQSLPEVAQPPRKAESKPTTVAVRRLLNGIACFLATVSLILGFNIQALPHVPYPAVGSLLPYEREGSWWPYSVQLLLAAWGLHFIRRFGEALFLHDYRSRILDTGHLCWYVAAPLHYTAFGFWIGWSMNYHFNPYTAPILEILLPALAVFAVGEVGNCVSHFKLRRLRSYRGGGAVYRKSQKSSLSAGNSEASAASPGHASRDSAVTEDAASSDAFIRSRLVNSRGHVLPTGFLYNRIVCPHYCFELITWFGYALATCTLASVCFLVVNFVILLLLARKRREEYIRTFVDDSGIAFKSTPSLLPCLF